VVHDHHGILGGLAAAFAAGRRNLRQAEDFFADLGLGARRALGLGRESPCDTTLYRLFSDQSPAGFEGTVFAHVKGLVAAKVVKNDRLKLGVVSFDGKGTWSRADGPRVWRVPGSRPTTCSASRATSPTSTGSPARAPPLGRAPPAAGQAQPPQAGIGSGA
jgi:hypothetical protein